MTRHRGYTFRIYPSEEQVTILLEWINTSRFIWNLALGQRVEYYNKQYPNRKINFCTQSAELKDLRKEHDWIKAYPFDTANIILRDLDKAYTSFFKRGGFPKFKSKKYNVAIPFYARDIKVISVSGRYGVFHFPKIKNIKFRNHRFHKHLTFDDVKFTDVRVFIHHGKWYVSIGMKTEKNISIYPNNRLSVGIDRGVTRPVQLSSGTDDYHLLPEQINVLEKRYRKGQRALKNKVRGSNRYKKAIARLAKLKARQTMCRKHWQHQVTKNIATRYDVVVLEKLQTKNMVRSAKGTKDQPGTNVSQKKGLNRSILNVGWFDIETKLKYKCKSVEYVNPQYTSQICSTCNELGNRESQSVFRCDCGNEMNADYNAAINIINRWNTPDVAKVKRRNTDELVILT